MATLNVVGLHGNRSCSNVNPYALWYRPSHLPFVIQRNYSAKRFNYLPTIFQLSPYAGLPFSLFFRFFNHSVFSGRPLSSHTLQPHSLYALHPFFINCSKCLFHEKFMFLLFKFTFFVYLCYLCHNTARFPSARSLDSRWIPSVRHYNARLPANYLFSVIERHTG